MPGIGPIHKNIYTYWPNNAKRTYKGQVGFRLAPSDRPPIRELSGKPPLPFVQHYVESKTPGMDCMSYHPSEWGVGNPPEEYSRYVADVHNRCHAKFVAKTQAAAAQIGADLGERRQTISTMAKRVDQLYRAALALKQRRWRHFLKELEMPYQVIRWKSFKSLADIWLEYHFGWEPLFEDIYNSIMVLQSPVPSLIKVKVRAQALPPRFVRSWRSGNGYYDWGDELIVYGTLREQMGARIRVTNPNLWKANQLGLTNPVAVAWEMVRFSFVVDWLIPVSQFINSWDAFLGLDIVEPYTTTTRFYKAGYKAFLLRSASEPFTDYSGISLSFIRTLGIQDPVLQLRPWKLPGLSRTATVSSLLIQLLDSFKNDLNSAWRYV